MAIPYPPDDGGDGYEYEPIVYTYDPVTGLPIGGVQDNNFTSGPIFKFFQKLGRYPSNSKQWWVAKAIADDPDIGQKAGDFLPELLETFFSGNNRAPRGHYILNQFHKDRSLVSGISGIPVEDVGERPSTVAFFSGRAWYGCQSTVYYSQILDNNSATKAGLCYQEADPTAEDISDLIATDGGVVPIPEADHIESIVPLGNGIMVFAQNGVWFISGGGDAFSALNISITKVSSIGTKSPGTIIEANDTIFWWSEIGVQAIQQASGQFGPIPGKFGNTNISEQTIQTFYNNISPNSKHMAKGIYDPLNNTVSWLFDSGTGLYYEYDSVLIYDITLQAFYPWKISNVGGGPRINGFFIDTGYIESAFASTVTDNYSNVVTDNVNVPVTVDIKELTIKPSNLFYLTEVPSAGLTVSAPVSLDYVDWNAFDGIGATYDSYILTGFELNNDAMRDKQIIYMFSHFRNTEDSTPSSCTMQARWDWSGNRDNRRWSTPVEAYRPRANFPTDVVISKNKVRGHGKSVQFRFGTSEPGKTFDLLGWSIGFSGITQP